MRNIFKKSFMTCMTAIFLIIISVAPFAVNANSDASFADGFPRLSDYEKSLITQISVDAKVTEEDITIAEKMRMMAEEEMDKSIEMDVSSGGILDYYSAVYLGTDQTFYYADWGDKDKGKSLLPTGIWESDYYLYPARDEAVVILGPPGVGGAWAYAQVGKQFTVVGSGSRTANIRMEGFYEGYLFPLAAGSAGIELNLVVKDNTTGAKYSTSILNESRSVAGYYEWVEAFNVGKMVLLQAGHDYTVYLELKASGGVAFEGGAFSDWGRQDGDYGGYDEYAEFYSISIDF